MESMITPAEIEQYYLQLKTATAASGCHLNPDTEFAKDLIESLLINRKRYGYPACPCRLATGKKDQDLDIICPCDYRDADLNDYATCYCSLYVAEQVVTGQQKLSGSIPERRSNKNGVRISISKTNPDALFNLPLPVWRCKVCGYLCARENQPQVCPICKASPERFERFI